MTSETSRRMPGELIFALVLVVFSVAAFWQAYGISGFSGKTTPGVFPMIASACMVISSCVIVVSAAKKNAPDPSASTFFSEILTFRHVVLLGFVLGYVVLMPILGFVLSSALFLFGAFQFLWRKHPLLILALTTFALVIIYVVFREVFQVVLPQGILLKGLF